MPKFRIVQTGLFKKDLKNARNRGYNMELLGTVVDTLALGEPLSEKYRAHSLAVKVSGDFCFSVV